MTRTIRLTTVLFVCVGLARPTEAHRLDECLHATRISIGLDRIGLEIDLTPGVSVAGPLLAAIDADGNGTIGAEEADRYAQHVLDSIRVSVDDRAAPLTRTAWQFSSMQELRLGIGTIRVSATAPAPRRSGQHAISYVSDDSSGDAVYLVNALMPADDRVEIVQQRRDPLQRSLTVDYRVAANAGSSRIGWSLAVIAIFGALVAARRKDGRRDP